VKHPSSEPDLLASGSQGGARIVAFSALQSLKQKMDQSKE
jgi:hypothetical protein